MARAIAAGLFLLALVGCAAQPSLSTVVATTPSPAATASASRPPPSPLNAEEVAAAVAVEMQAECVPPVDELLCSVVQFEWITFEDGILSVPTSLDADAVDVAERLCSSFDTANMNQGSRAPLGIMTIDILSATNALIASCESEA